MRTLSLPFSLAFSPFPPALRRCISSADESGGSETEYGIAEGGRPIERARGMQSERSRCCHVTERARARARAARRERANAWTTIFPNQCPATTFFLFFFLSFFFLLFFRFLLLIPRFLSAFTPCSPALHHSRANANESHLPSVFANVYEGREKTSLPFPRCRFYLVSAEF